MRSRPIPEVLPVITAAHAAALSVRDARPKVPISSVMGIEGGNHFLTNCFSSTNEVSILLQGQAKHSCVFNESELFSSVFAFFQSGRMEMFHCNVERCRDL